MAFAQIIGQPQAVKLLQRAIKRGKLAHAYLLTGAEGVGKTSCGIALAQALNCGESSGEGCGKCPVCRKISQFNSPDFTKIEPGGPSITIPIGEIRRLRREIHLKPVEGKYKIFLLSNADRMNEESSNALLKVLEEPPEKSMLILSTSHPNLLLPTILSRCHVVLFRRLKPEEIAMVLHEKTHVEDVRFKFVLNLSGGSPGKALSLLDEGLEERHKIISWLQKSEINDINNILAMAEKKTSGPGTNSPEQKEKLITFIETVLSWYRDLFMAALGKHQFINEDYARELVQASRLFSVGRAKKSLQLILQARRYVELNANTRLILEVLFLNLATMGDHRGPPLRK